MNFNKGDSVLNLKHVGWGVGTVIMKGDDLDYLVAFPEAKGLHSGNLKAIRKYVPEEYKGKCWWCLTKDLIGGTLKDYEDTAFVEVDKESLRKVIEAYSHCVGCDDCYLSEACRLSAEHSCVSFMMSKLIKQVPPPKEAMCLTAPTNAAGTINYLTIQGTFTSVYGVPAELEPSDLVGKIIYYRERKGKLMYWGQKI